MKIYLLTNMLRALILTIIFELVLAIILGVRKKKDCLNIILVNVLTNPLVTSISFFINLRYGLIPRNISMIFLEVFAVITEGYIYFKVLNYKKINGLYLAIILNVFSYSIGEIINNFLL